MLHRAMDGSPVNSWRIFTDEGDFICKFWRAWVHKDKMTSRHNNVLLHVRQSGRYSGCIGQRPKIGITLGTVQQCRDSH